MNMNKRADNRAMYVMCSNNMLDQAAIFEHIFMRSTQVLMVSHIWNGERCH